MWCGSITAAAAEDVSNENVKEYLCGMTAIGTRICELLQRRQHQQLLENFCLARLSYLTCEEHLVNYTVHLDTRQQQQPRSHDAARE